MPLKSLSVIIPNYNGIKLIKEFLPCALNAVSEYKGKKEVIFVDDSSEDDSMREAMKFLKKYSFLKIVKTPVNGGFSQTSNFGAKKAFGEIFFFLNNDVQLDRSYFSTFNNYFIPENIFALATCGYNYQTKKQLDGIKQSYWRRGFFRCTNNIFNHRLPSSNSQFLSFGFQGSYFFVNDEKFKQLKGFDEIYSPYIMEETDLAYRALNRGWKILYGPEFKAYHKCGSTINSTTSRKAQIIAFRNKLLFTWKNIHSRGLIQSHCVFLFLKLITLNPIEWMGFAKALKLAKQITKRRKEEKKLATISDAFLFAFYKKYFIELLKTKSIKKTNLKTNSL